MATQAPTYRSPAAASTQEALRHLFVDMNSYFASCEQQLRPELRDRPVGVAALLVGNTACIALSIEAKRRGLRVGVRVAEAKQVCPDIVILESRPSEYVRLHHAIVAAVDTVLPVKAVMSIDELDCLLAAGQRDESAARALGLAVKEAIRRRVGSHLRCSIGIAPNTLLAKIATDLQKPDGLVVLNPCGLPDALHKLDLTDLPGIATGMLARLHRAGVYDVATLCRLSETQMRSIWGGVVGQRWWYWLRGLTWQLPATRRRTVGHSHVLAPEWRDPDRAAAVAVRLAHRVAARMRSMGYHARRLVLQLRLLGHQGRWEGRRCLGCTRSTGLIIRELETLRRHWPPGRVLQVSVTLTHLVADSGVTLPLFPEEERDGRADDVIDAVNAYTGRQTIYYANMYDAQQTAPPRISFSGLPLFNADEQQ